MITLLHHKEPKTSEEIYCLWQQSYAVEAALLNAKDFPPLKRTAADFRRSSNTFYGFMVEAEIAGIIEIDTTQPATHIQSLVVKPKHFRKGIAKALLEFVFDHYSSDSFTVETGLKNEPAVNLYKTFQFVETHQWDTDHGVRKIRFAKKIAR